MKRFTLFEYYALGNELRRLDICRRDATLDSVFPALYSSEVALKQIDPEKAEIFPLSRNAAEELLAQVRNLTRGLFHDENGKFDLNKDWNEIVNAWQMGVLVTALDKFEHVFAAETQQSATYFVPRVGIYDTACLIEATEQHIPAELRDQIEADAIAEFQAAGKCLAFNLPTASGFHAMRAVEIVLDDYYNLFAGQAKKANLKTWKDYIVELDAFAKDMAKNPRPSKKTIRTLDQLRDLDRNPLMHPRDVHDLTAAQVLFNLAGSVIAAMAVEMKAIAPAMPAPVYGVLGLAAAAGVLKS